MNRIPVIIDTDPGHDDAIALMMALASPRLDIRGHGPVIRTHGATASNEKVAAR